MSGAKTTLHHQLKSEYCIILVKTEHRPDGERGSMEYRFNRSMPDDIISLSKRSGTRILSRISAVTALKNSLFTVGIYDGDVLVAFGRVCGDDALCFVVCDVMVDEAYREQHLEVQILKELDTYLRSVVTRESQVYVHVSRPYDEVCQRYGFKYLDGDYEVMMKR